MWEQYFSELLNYNNTLTTLILDNTGIRDEGIELIIDALKNNHSLTILDIGGNKISLEQYGEISHYIRRNNEDFRALSHFIEDNEGIFAQWYNGKLGDLIVQEQPNFFPHLNDLFEDGSNIFSAPNTPKGALECFSLLAK